MSKPLEAAERDLLKQARIAKLIGAWANATRRLTPDEIAEVESEHPGLITAPSPQPAAAVPFALQPDAPLPAKLRGYYLYPLKHYAVVYGYDANSGERTIKRFVSVGRNVIPHDLPPLDEPAKMPAWWRLHHGNRTVPPGIRHAAANAVVNASPSPAPAPQREPDTYDNRPDVYRSEHPIPAAPAPTPPPVPREATPLAAEPSRLDFPSQVAELRKIADEQLQQLRTASVELPPESLTDSVDRADWARSKGERVESAQRNYKSTWDLLRKAENDLVEWQKSHEELKPTAQVASEVGRIVGAIHAAVKRLTKSVRPRLAGKSDAEQDAIWEEETRKCFRILTGSKFALPFEQ